MKPAKLSYEVKQPATALVWLCIIIALAVGSCALSGCALWPSAQEDPTNNGSLTVDAVSFDTLQWKYGGFNGSGAKLDVPRISNLSVKSNGLSLTWDVNLSGWGLSNDDWRGALACLFCKVDGVWKGGKMDWISSSRATRDFHNIRDGYNGWDKQAIERADAYAFVVVSADGKRRSNVVATGVK